MNLRRIKHMFLRLSLEERMVGIGAVIVLVSAFLPWYSVVFNFEKGATESGFSGDLGVIGFVVFLLSAMALIFLMAEHLQFKFFKFSQKKEQITLFLMGESAFLLLLTIAIYTKRSFEFTNAELRFGIYLALIGAFVGTFAAFSQIQKEQKEETEAFFSHPEEVEEKTLTTKSEKSHSRTKNLEIPAQTNTHKEEKVEVQQEVQQEKFFYEEDESPNTEGADHNPRIEEENLEPDTEPDPAEGDPEPDPEEEPIKDPIEIPMDNPAEEETTPQVPESEPITAAEKEVNPKNPSADQGLYFSREAGIKVDTDSIRRVDKSPASEEQAKQEPEEDKVSNQNTSFYDDL